MIPLARIEQIQRRVAGATGWPWRLHRNAIKDRSGLVVGLMLEPAHSDLVVNAPSDLQVLLDEREALLAQVAVLERELKAVLGGDS